MDDELERRLLQVPQRWREATRTRVNAVMDYLIAGELGSTLVPILCKRTGLTTSAFYTLVRRWKASGGDVVQLAPWSRRPTTPPRIDRASTTHIDAVVNAAIALNPAQPVEPLARRILRDWPERLPHAGISFVRRRVDEGKKRHAMATGSAPPIKIARGPRPRIAPEVAEHVDRSVERVREVHPAANVNMLVTLVLQDWPYALKAPSYSYIFQRISRRQGDR